MDNYVTRKIHLEFEANYEFPKDWNDDNIRRYLAEIDCADRFRLYYVKEFGNSHRGCELTKIYVKPKDD